MFIHIQQLPSSLSNISFRDKATGNQMKHNVNLSNVITSLFLNIAGTILEI